MKKEKEEGKEPKEEVYAGKGKVLRKNITAV
jgi:hypothetical protein